MYGGIEVLLKSLTALKASVAFNAWEVVSRGIEMLM